MPPALPHEMAVPELIGATEEWLTAVTIASEVPPKAMGKFTDAMITPALRAVCEVIQNRVDSSQFPDRPLEVVLQIKQFSGVLRGVSLGATGHSKDYWLDAVAGKWQIAHCQRALAAWRTRRDQSQLMGGAMWYYSPISMQPQGRKPAWAADLHEVPLPAVHTDYFRWFAP